MVHWLHAGKPKIMFSQLLILNIIEGIGTCYANEQQRHLALTKRQNWLPT